MACQLTQDQINQTVAFHGHECPGLWIGIRAAELCLRELGHNNDVPLVTVVETDMCGVDALQVLTGCTFGKGNLIHHDVGKSAFSFYRRSDGKALRAVYNREALGPEAPAMRALNKKVFDGLATAEEESQVQAYRAQSREKVMTADLEKLFTLTPLAAPPPRSARILESLPCSQCRELTMESRTRRFDGKTFCIPCFKDVEQKLV